MDKIKLPMPIVVEGKYDKIKLSSVFDGCILTTDGFGIFNKKEKLALIKRLAGQTGIIILTDSDGAGKLIRSHLSSAVPPEKIYQLYIPQIQGKESRKIAASKEGFLGVEGMEASLLYDLLKKFAEANGFDSDGITESRTKIAVTKTDLYTDGFSGGPDSSRLRDELAAKLSLPAGMTTNALLAAINILISKEEYDAAAAEIKGMDH